MDEIADDGGLFHPAGIGVVEIIAGAGPAELGDDDALAGMHLAQLVVKLEAVVDRMGVIKTLPVRQDMRGDEVDGRGELRMVDPNCPDFASSYRDRALPFHLLDELDQVVDGHLGAQRGFVADDDGVDVAIVAGEIESGADFALVAFLVLVDPGADRDLKPELSGDRRYELGAACRRIGADGARVGRDSLQIGTDLFGGGALTDIGVRRIRERGVGDARELTGEIRCSFFGSQQCPQPCMHARYKREHSYDGAHRLSTTRGEGYTGPNLSPRFDVGRKAMRLPCERQTNK